MEGFREAWTSLLSWLPPPVRLAVAIVIAVLIITKLAPRFVRACGILLHAAWRPLLEVLTYPEYLLTSLSRRSGWQVLPGTYAYDRALGTLASGGTRLGQWLRTRFPAYPRFPLKTTILIAALLIACWYLAPKTHASGPRTVLGHVNTDVVRVDSWLATGRWKQPVTHPANSCSPTGPATPKHAHHKRHRKHK